MNAFTIGILGNYNPDYFPHKRMGECLNEFRTHFNLNYEWVATESLLEPHFPGLGHFHGIISGSGPYKSKEGVIEGIRFARKNNIPFMGTCSGFSYAIMEFGQDLLNIPEVKHPYNQEDISEYELLLAPLNHCETGVHSIYFKPQFGTHISRIYGMDKVEEQSHCTYGIHPSKIETFKKLGFIASGADEQGEPKIMEYSPNDFHIVTLFLPQVKSNPENPHPLIFSFLKAAENRILK